MPVLQNVTKPLREVDPTPDASPFLQLLKAIDLECWYQMHKEEWDAIGFGRDLAPT